MKKRLTCILLNLFLVVLILNSMTALAANNNRAKLKEGWYYLRCMYNYLNIDADGNAELRNKTNTAVGNTKFLVHQMNGGWVLEIEDGKYLGVELPTSLTESTKNNDKMNGARIKLVYGDLSRSSYVWDIYSENNNDIWSLRPRKNTDVVLNASGQENEDGTPIILWTHIDIWRSSSKPNPDAPNHAQFRFISADDPYVGTPKTPADGWYNLKNVATDKKVGVDSWDIVKLVSMGETKKGVFYVENMGNNQITLRLPDGRYLATGDTIKDGYGVKMVKNPYLWNCYSEDITGLKSQGIYSLRPPADTKILASVADYKNTSGIPILLRSHTSMDAPENAEFKFEPYEGELSGISWNAPLMITKTEATIYASKQIKLYVLGNKGTIQWSSSDRTIATVTKDGVVKGRKEGIAIITASVDGVDLNCIVSVKKIN